MDVCVRTCSTRHLRICVRALALSFAPVVSSCGSGLNHGLIHEWIRVLTSDAETMGKFYETWAFVRFSDDALPQMTAALQPLAQYKYTLSLDYEISRWDLH